MAEQQQMVSLQATLNSFIKMMQDPEVIIPITYALPLGDLSKMAIGLLNGDLFLKTKTELEGLVLKPPPPGAGSKK